MRGRTCRERRSVLLRVVAVEGGRVGGLAVADGDSEHGNCLLSWLVGEVDWGAKRGRSSMMRRILPSERSIARGSLTTVPAVTPMVFLIKVDSWAPAASAADGSASGRRSTWTVIVSSR